MKRGLQFVAALAAYAIYAGWLFASNCTMRQFAFVLAFVTVAGCDAHITGVRFTCVKRAADTVSTRYSVATAYRGDSVCTIEGDKEREYAEFLRFHGGMP